MYFEFQILDRSVLDLKTLSVVFGSVKSTQEKFLDLRVKEYLLNFELQKSAFVTWLSIRNVFQVFNIFNKKLFCQIVI